MDMSGGKERLSTSLFGEEKEKLFVLFNQKERVCYLIEEQNKWEYQAQENK